MEGEYEVVRDVDRDVADGHYGRSTDRGLSCSQHTTAVTVSWLRVRRPYADGHR
jgi:hypothetical protein